MILPYNLATFDGEKYLAKNLLDISSHIAIESIGSELNHIFAVSFNEKGKLISKLSLLVHHCVFKYHIFRGSLQCVCSDRHWENHQTDINFAPSEATPSSTRSYLY